MLELASKAVVVLSCYICCLNEYMSRIKFVQDQSTRQKKTELLHFDADSIFWIQVQGSQRQRTRIDERKSLFLESFALRAHFMLCLFMNHDGYRI